MQDIYSGVKIHDFEPDPNTVDQLEELLKDTKMVHKTPETHVQPVFDSDRLAVIRGTKASDSDDEYEVLENQEPKDEKETSDASTIMNEHTLVSKKLQIESQQFWSYDEFVAYMERITNASVDFNNLVFQKLYKEKESKSLKPYLPGITEDYQKMVFPQEKLLVSLVTTVLCDVLTKYEYALENEHNNTDPADIMKKILQSTVVLYGGAHYHGKDLHHSHIISALQMIPYVRFILVDMSQQTLAFEHLLKEEKYQKYRDRVHIKQAKLTEQNMRRVQDFFKKRKQQFIFFSDCRSDIGTYIDNASEHCRLTLKVLAEAWKQTGSQASNDTLWLNALENVRKLILEHTKCEKRVLLDNIFHRTLAEEGYQCSTMCLKMRVRYPLPALNIIMPPGDYAIWENDTKEIFMSMKSITLLRASSRAKSTELSSMFIRKPQYTNTKKTNGRVWNLKDIDKCFLPDIRAGDRTYGRTSGKGMPVTSKTQLPRGDFEFFENIPLDAPNFQHKSDTCDKFNLQKIDNILQEQNTTASETPINFCKRLHEYMKNILSESDKDECTDYNKSDIGNPKSLKLQWLKWRTQTHHRLDHPSEDDFERQMYKLFYFLNKVNLRDHKAENIDTILIEHLKRWCREKENKEFLERVSSKEAFLIESHHNTTGFFHFAANDLAEQALKISIINFINDSNKSIAQCTSDTISQIIDSCMRNTWLHIRTTGNYHVPQPNDGSELRHCMYETPHIRWFVMALQEALFHVTDENIQSSKFRSDVDLFFSRAIYKILKQKNDEGKENPEHEAMQTFLINTRIGKKDVQTDIHDLYPDLNRTTLVQYVFLRTARLLLHNWGDIDMFSDIQQYAFGKNLLQRIVNAEAYIYYNAMLGVDMTTVSRGGKYQRGEPKRIPPFDIMAVGLDAVYGITRSELVRHRGFMIDWYWHFACQETEFAKDHADDALDIFLKTFPYISYNKQGNKASLLYMLEETKSEDLFLWPAARTALHAFANVGQENLLINLLNKTAPENNEKTEALGNETAEALIRVLTREGPDGVSLGQRASWFGQIKLFSHILELATTHKIKLNIDTRKEYTNSTHNDKRVHSTWKLDVTEMYDKIQQPDQVDFQPTSIEDFNNLCVEHAAPYPCKETWGITIPMLVYMKTRLEQQLSLQSTYKDHRITNASDHTKAGKSRQPKPHEKKNHLLRAR